MMKEKKTFLPITWQLVSIAYTFLHDRGYITFPLTASAQSKVESALSSAQGKYFGQEIYQTPEEKMVAVLYFLVKDHPFTDGNKRTASFVFAIGCELHSLEPQLEGFALDELVVFIERIKLDDHQRFIKDLTRMLFPLKNDQN